MLHFANNLRIKRKLFGWTQSKAAEEIARQYKQNAIDSTLKNVTDTILLEALKNCSSKYEVSTERYQQWELGRSEPELELLIAITEVFQIDDQYFFLKKPIKVKLVNTKFLHVDPLT
jgi:transcriptional regulator with XRE-family HTH domain